MHCNVLLFKLEEVESQHSLLWPLQETDKLSKEM